MAEDQNPEDRVSRLADGFNRIARDFDRALIAARLEWGHYLLIQQAREESWMTSQIDRSNKPRPFRLNLSRIARDLGVDRSSLSERHAQLVNARIFLKQEDNTYIINKDYRDWTSTTPGDPSPLLSNGRLNWSKQIRRKVRSVGSNLQSLLAGTYSPLQPESPSRRLEPTETVGSNLHPLLVPTHSPLQPDFGHNTVQENGLEPKTVVASIGSGAESFLREREFNSLSLTQGDCREREKISATPDETDACTPVEYRMDPEEPFAGIEDAPPPPIVLTPEQARLKASVQTAALKATCRDDYPGGLPDAAEALADWALDKLAEGAKVSAIRDSVGKSCRKMASGMDWGRGPAFAESCLRTWKADPSSRSNGDAWKPSQSKPVAYFQIPPLPPEGSR